MRALTGLGHSLGLTLEQAALGVIEVTNTHMERALRVISVDRGHDPRDFILVSFGGAGGLHAADLARRLGIPKVLVPPQAATLSALGMLLADVVKDYSQTVMLSGNTSMDRVSEELAPLLLRAQRDLSAEGLPAEALILEPFVDCRYRGQSFELMVPFRESLLEDFHHAHQLTFGYADPKAEVELVNVRVRAAGKTDRPSFQKRKIGPPEPTMAFLEKRDVVFSGDAAPVSFYKGDMLKPGNRIQGPAVILRQDTTILITAQDRAEMDGFSNLVLHVEA